MASQIALRIDRLKTLREQHSLSQRELSRRCGLGLTQVSKYENHQADPSATHLMLIAQQLGVTTDYLLGNTDDPHIQVREPALNADEHQMVEMFRREGWPGVVRLGVERITK